MRISDWSSDVVSSDPLTPFYPFDEDVRHWHRVARDLCQPFGGEARYLAHKRWCDTYFFLKHRNETRGVGGLFFDYLCDGGFDACFAFQRAVGDGFLDCFFPLVGGPGRERGVEGKRGAGRVGLGGGRVS